MTEAYGEPGGLTVTGVGRVRAEPGLARVALVVEVVEPSPDLAFRNAGEAVSRLRGVLRRHGLADEGVSASRLALASEFDGYGTGRRFVGYACRAAYGVETEALDGLQRLIVDVVAAGAQRIDGVEFDVRDREALGDEARRRAVADARRRAGVYAGAAGVRLGPVVSLRDLEAGPAQAPGLRAGAGGGPAGDLAPGAVELTAAVRVGWALIP
ncbi:SIMPL domain-containing protein [Streptomyces sp. NPDC052077]|uniref:SIMPL domain-containing protein n=1 Tax=Streptomyces sp. NPDC052077 TaxID=3154757 RepID=UPI0034370762